MDENKFAILLTDAQEVKILECNPQKEMFDIARDAIGCEWIELVEPAPLACDGMLMMIDEESKLKGMNFINCIASSLYGSDRHGDPIVGNAVIVKFSGDSLELLSVTEAKQLSAILEQSRESSIKKIAAAFGLQPTPKRDVEGLNKSHRQPCKKDSWER